MTPEELRRDEARRRLTVASRDLKAAEILSTTEPSGSTFHSQQTAEKAVKAFLTFHNVFFRKVHDLKELGEQCSAIDPTFVPLMKEAADLTSYAVQFRYVDAPRELDEAEAKHALDIARLVYDRVRALVA